MDVSFGKGNCIWDSPRGAFVVFNTHANAWRWPYVSHTILISMETDTTNQHLRFNQILKLKKPGKWQIEAVYLY